MNEKEARQYRDRFVSVGIREVRIIHRNEVRGVWPGEYGRYSSPRKPTRIFMRPGSRFGADYGVVASIPVPGICRESSPAIYTIRSPRPREPAESPGLKRKCDDPASGNVGTRSLLVFCQMGNHLVALPAQSAKHLRGPLPIAPVF